MTDMYDQLVADSKVDPFAGTVFEDWDTTTDQTVSGWTGAGGFDVHEKPISHNITSDSAGHAMAAFVKAGGWHGLGTVVQEPKSTAELMKIGGVDYEVLKIPAVIIDPISGEKVPVPNVQHTYRRDRLTKALIPLGTVSDAYPIFQLEDCFLGFGDAILAETTSKAASCAALFGGKVAFMCWLLDRDIVIGDGDRTQMWMMARTSFDKSCAFDVCVGPLRTACGNTMRWNIRNCVTRWSVRHTRNAKAKATVEDAQRSLELTFKYADEWESLSKQLLATPMNTQQFDTVVTKVFGPNEPNPSKQTARLWADKHAKIMTLFTEAPNLEGVRNTAYAAINAVGEWADWLQGSRPKEASQKLFLKANPGGYQFVRSMIQDDRAVTVPKQKIMSAVGEWAGIKV